MKLIELIGKLQDLRELVGNDVEVKLFDLERGFTDATCVRLQVKTGERNIVIE